MRPMAQIGDGVSKKGIPLTPLQINRQLHRIKKLIFTGYEEGEDGSYQGEINKEVVKILEKYMKVETIEYIDFILLVQKCSQELLEWVNEKIEGIDKRLLTLYTYDFITQSMDAIYIIKDNEEDNDPMFI